MTHDAHKQHKVIHKLDERISAVENVVLVTAQTAAILLTVIGFFGFVTTLLFDKVARGIWQEFGWMQLAGLVIFFVVFLIGSVMLTVIKKITK